MKVDNLFIIISFLILILIFSVALHFWSFPEVLFGGIIFGLGLIGGMAFRSILFMID